MVSQLPNQASHRASLVVWFVDILGDIKVGLGGSWLRLGQHSTRMLQRPQSSNYTVRIGFRFAIGHGTIVTAITLNQ